MTTTAPRPGCDCCWSALLVLDNVAASHPGDPKVADVVRRMRAALPGMTTSPQREEMCHAAS